MSARDALFGPGGGLFARGEGRQLRKAMAALDIAGKGGLALLDLGAAGDLPPRFEPVAAFLDYTGFEPDERTREALLARDSGCLAYRILPHALGAAEGEAEFRLCRKPEASSVFEPDRELLDRFPESERFDVVERRSVPLVPLDSVAPPRCDFLKADVQGGELDALRGGAATLRQCFGFELEVGFLPLYKHQPLFGEICTFAAGQGFEFHDFLFLGRWRRDAAGRLGQCVFADALFLRPPEAVAASHADEARQAAYLALLLIYRRYDLARRFLDCLPAGDRQSFAALVPLLDAMERRLERVERMLRLARRLVAGTAPGVDGHLLY